MGIAFVFSLLMIAFFSATETAFVASDKIALIVGSNRKRQGISVEFFIQNQELFFATIVIGSNLWVTIFSNLTELLLGRQFGIDATMIAVISTGIGVILGDIIPKSVALDYPERAATFLLPIVRIFYRLSRPIVTVTERIASAISVEVFGYDRSAATFQKKDIYRLLSGTISSGTLDRIESEIVKRLLENSQTSVKTIMVPRTSLVALDIRSDIDLLKTTFERCGKSKILIYENTIDNIVGVVHINDIFSESDSVKDLVRDILFVPETISITDLMQQFRRYGLYVSVVVDEFGGTAGLVTSSDVMQSFIGDVAVPELERRIKEISPGVYLIPGSADITEVENSLGIELPKGDYLTVGGLLESQLGRVPVDGEKVKIGLADFVVLKADHRRIVTVKVNLKQMNQN